MAINSSTEDERTPLLTVAKPKATPLPKAAIFALCFCRFCEPIALTVIFPFVNQMVQDTGIDPSQVGYRAGLIESLFTAAQFATILQLGRLSDRIGRKPVILLGLAGAGVSTLSFGFSHTFVMMVVARVTAGLLNGNVGVIKSSLGELTDHTNEARAFAFLPLAWTSGAALGPILGGYLANPAKRYPSMFGGVVFFEEYKYFLPCFVAALAPVLGILIGSLYMRETLPHKSRPSTPTEEAGEYIAKAAPQAVSIKEVLTSRVRWTLLNYGMLAFTSMAIAAILPLFLYTPVELGGVGFSEAQIGKAMALHAIGAAACHLIIFPPLQRRLGTIRVFRLVVPLYPIVCAFFPITSYVAHQERGNGSQASSRTWTILVIQLALLSMCNMAYACNMLLINASAPSQRALGSLNGVAQMQASLVRTAALAVAPALFALSINKHLLGGYAIWIFMVVVACGLCGTSWLVSDAKAAWRDDIVKDVSASTHDDEDA